MTAGSAGLIVHPRRAEVVSGFPAESVALTWKLHEHRRQLLVLVVGARLDLPVPDQRSHLAGGGRHQAVHYNVGGSTQLVDIRAQSRQSSEALSTMGNEVTLGTSAG